MAELPILERYSIDTAHGTYIIKKPGGRLAIRHFNIMKKAFPKNYDEEGKPVLTADDDMNAEVACEQWCTMVLPGIIESFPPGIKTYEEMPGEDQYTIWQAMYRTITMGVSEDELFRIERISREGERASTSV